MQQTDREFRAHLMDNHCEDDRDRLVTRTGEFDLLREAHESLHQKEPANHSHVNGSG